MYGFNLYELIDLEFWRAQFLPSLFYLLSACEHN